MVNGGLVPATGASDSISATVVASCAMLLLGQGALKGTSARWDTTKGECVDNAFEDIIAIELGE